MKQDARSLHIERGWYMPSDPKGCTASNLKSHESPQITSLPRNQQYSCSIRHRCSCGAQLVAIDHVDPRRSRVGHSNMAHCMEACCFVFLSMIIMLAPLSNAVRLNDSRVSSNSTVFDII
eukprot:1596697-Amphidinium_carterae.2